MTTNWKALADKAVEEGYQPGNEWEAMLRRHLNRCFPERVKELGPNLESYLRAATFEAMLFAERLEEQGTPNQDAEELALRQLLPTAPDEIDRPSRSEMEHAAEDLEAATLRGLLSTPTTNRLPRKTPLTSPPETTGTEN